MNTKHCHKCNRDLPADADNFYRNKAKPDGLGTQCKRCQNETNKVYCKNNRGTLHNLEIKYKLAVKEEVFSHYCGGTIKCKRCGYIDIRALSLDHINGNGSKHRKELNARGTQFYKWVKRNGYPSNFQVLCMNCQWLKRHENNEHNGRK